MFVFHLKNESLLKVLPQMKIKICELVNFKKSKNGDLLVTNFTSGKRVKLNFEKLSLIVSYSKVCEIVIETSTYAIINVKGRILNLEETEQKVCKNGKTLQIRKAEFKDSIDCIPVTYFDNNMSKIFKAKGYKITHVYVSLFQAQRILKTTETTEITEDDNCKYNVTKLQRGHPHNTYAQKLPKLEPPSPFVGNCANLA